MKYPIKHEKIINKKEKKSQLSLTEYILYIYVILQVRPNVRQCTSTDFNTVRTSFMCLSTHQEDSKPHIK